VLGIISIPVSFIPLAGLVLGGAGLTAAIFGNRAVRVGVYKGRGLATIGAGAAAIGLGLAIGNAMRFIR
jgi:hypothetical protein